MEYVLYVALVAFAYLMGAIPWGLVIGKRTRNIDLRQFGSGNIGATNALRTLGWKSSLVVFILDIAKAVIAVLLARLLTGLPALEALCGFVAIVGHNWPVYIGFRGGKGVSSSLGVMMLLSLPMAAVGLLVGLAVIGSSRYVSLGSVVGASIVPVLMLAFAGALNISTPYLICAWALGAMVVFQHRDNLRRLLAGTERKIGQLGERRVGPSEPINPSRKVGCE
ncbi:MAG: glycerol-3-phosphate 1-O-acyltransferase PlsY [Chloroflexi bacterium]|nr:glycerol-3-phosphate 1-O-acyltransferase PlsY [Chloroflexota bacterium]